jgi:dienelactone hydrolase
MLITVLTLLVIELAQAAYSLVTRSPQLKTRSVIRLVLFGAFVMLLLSPLIQWNFRWYGLAALLFVQAVYGLWRLYKLRFSAAKDGIYRPAANAAGAAAGVLLVFVSITPALIFPPYQPLPASGPYAAATARYTYTDENRTEQYAGREENRNINVTFWFPENTAEADTYPLVVFSHGGLGLETGSESLFLELASHGYVVASIGHPYHAFWTRDVNGRLTLVNMDYFRELQQEDASGDRQQSYQYYQKWMETRTGDINLAVDTILEKAASRSEGVYGRVDPERIGLMGHSLGGSAALAVPRQRTGIRAVIALESPFLYDITGVQDGQFIWTDEAYPVPVLNIYSDSSWAHLNEWPQYFRNAELLSSPSAGALSLHLPGAGHFSLTDLALASPWMVRILEGEKAARSSTEYLGEVSQACLEFLNRHLKYP